MGGYGVLGTISYTTIKRCAHETDCVQSCTCELPSLKQPLRHALRSMTITARTPRTEAESVAASGRARRSAEPRSHRRRRGSCELHGLAPGNAMQPCAITRFLKLAHRLQGVL
eukprot:7385436-Prymnesium_polylepis.3